MFLKNVLLSSVLLLSLNATEIEDFVNFSKCDQHLKNKYFSVCYDYDKKVAKSVYYNLDGENVDAVNIKASVDFYEDFNIPKRFRANPRDYIRSGYDRGHLSSDASFDYSAESLHETYSMSNIAPQTPTLNRNVWIKSEKYERLVAKKLGSLWVINNVEFPKKNNKTIGDSNISVPNKFYKIMYNDEKEFKKCFEFDNIDYEDVESDRLEHHEIDCRLIEI